MKITPSQQKIGELLDIGGSADYYKIPDYQRNYSWTERYWEDLITDIEDNDRGYFIGTLITVENDNNERIEILDGQQRLTTISILLIALYNVAKEKYNIEDADDRDALSDLRRRLVDSRNGIKSQRVDLLTRDNNQFRYLLKEYNIIVDIEDYSIDNRYKNLIIKAFNYFTKWVKEYSREKIDELIDKIGYLTTVKIKAEELSDAYLLFEALNGKSLPLTIIDLLKLAYFQLEPDNDRAEKKWSMMMESLDTDDTPTNIRFILNNYRAFAVDYGLTSDQTITKATAIKKYQELLKKKGADFIDELIGNARIFKEITKDNKNIEKIRKLDISQFYPLLMYVIKHQDEMNINDTDFELLTKNIGSFFVRRNISNIPQARDVARMILNTIQNINGKVKDDVLNIIFETLEKNTIDDEEFYKYLNEANVYEVTGVTKYMFSCIEDEKTHRNLKKGINRNFDAKTEKGQPIWQIEHILPQNDNLNNAWIEMLLSENVTDETFADQRDRATDIQREYLHRLGNLTITAYNSEMSDHSYNEKLNLEDKNGQKIGLNNDLWLNESVVCNEVWTQKEIKDRTELLAEEFVSFFSIKK